MTVTGALSGTKDALGYAVIDTETTGFRASGQDRIVEIGIVHVNLAGEITGEWATLVNPERDLGPQHIHGIRAADVRHAPTFGEIAGTVANLLRGRLMTAHNLSFDLRFLAHEFGRLGISTPLNDGFGLCTMTWAGHFLPDAPRSLAGCCAMADIPLNGQHDALIDARAAAQLLRHYLTLTGPSAPWRGLFAVASEASWADIPDTGTPWVRRGVSAQWDSHFLSRIVDRLPRVKHPDAADSYLALLDQALLDHYISASEADALVELAGDLGLLRADVEQLHGGYLTALAQSALADGVLTDSERHELHLVATLLEMSPQSVDHALARAAEETSRPITRFQLQEGDLVVFTGEMDGDRETWEERARDAGYIPHSNVTKKVRLLVAADPDSLSGKARKARGYGIPIITPEAFKRMMAVAR